MQIFYSLSKTQKARMISIFIISILLFTVNIIYISEFKDIFFIEYTDEVMVDGSNFAPFVNLLTFGFNGFLYILTIIATIIIMIFLSLILLIPWRLIAIKKDSVINENEYEIYKKILIIFVILSIALGLIILRFKGIFTIIILTFIPSILIFLFCVLPIKSRTKTNQEL